MQIELVAGKSVLDIGDVSFNITFRSPTGKQSGSYIYQFTIPYTAKNAKAFGWIYRTTRFDQLNSKIEGSIKVDGLALVYGVWFAKSTSGKTITLTMYIGSGIFNERIHGKKMPELFDIQIVYPNIIEHIEQQVTKTFPEVNHNWPSIYNEGFYGKDDDNVNPDFKGVLNDFYNDTVHIENTNSNAISPQLYYGFVINHIFEFAGYKLVGDIFEDPRLKASMFYNNFALDKVVPSTFSGEVYNNYPVYSFDIIVWDENINDSGSHYNTSTGKYNVDKQGSYLIDIYLKFKESYLPTDADTAILEIYYGSTLIDSVEKICAFGAKPYFTIDHDYTHDILQADIGEDIYCKFYYIDSNLDKIESYIIEGNISIINRASTDNNTFDNVINYKNHVPDIDVKTFLDDFYSIMNIIPFFDSEFKEVKLVFFEDLIASNKHIPFTKNVHKDSTVLEFDDYEGITFKWNFQNPDDNLKDNFIDTSQAAVLGTKQDFQTLLLTSANAGDIYFVDDLNCYYIFQADDPEAETLTYSWYPYSDNHTDFVIDEGKKEIICNVAPMLMRGVGVERNSVVKYRYLPSVNSKGTSLGFGIKNKFPHRIMFYHGIEDSDTDQYPIASTIKVTYEGTQIFDYNWSWDEIIQRYFKLYVIWLKTRINIKFNRDISSSDIANSDLSVKGLKDGSHIIFSELIAKISNSKSLVGSYKGWTI